MCICYSDINSLVIASSFNIFTKRLNMWINCYLETICLLKGEKYGKKNKMCCVDFSLNDGSRSYVQLSYWKFFESRKDES